MDEIFIVIIIVLCWDVSFYNNYNKIYELNKCIIIWRKEFVVIFYWDDLIILIDSYKRMEGV